jgi:hypothetical protein
MTRIKIGSDSEVVVRGSFDEVRNRLIEALGDDESFVEFQRDSGSLCWLNPRWVSAVIRSEGPGDPIAIAIL